jgi:hypothetical protein
MASWVEAGPGSRLGGGDAVLELRIADPSALGDAEAAEPGDVSRRATEACDADPQPLPGNGAQ